MAITPFQLESSKFIQPGGITPGPSGEAIYIGDDQFNGAGLNYSDGIRVIVQYEDMQGSPANQAAVQAIVEGKTDGGDYYILAYQFREYRGQGADEGHRSHIYMTPNVVWDAASFDNIVFVGGKTVERISPQPGFLPEVWRISLILRDPIEAFISLTFSIYGERFNQLVLPQAFRAIISDTDTGNVVTEDLD